MVSVLDSGARAESDGPLGSYADFTFFTMTKRFSKFSRCSADSVECNQKKSVFRARVRDI